MHDTQPIVEIVPVATAADLLAALRPADSRWGSHPRSWVFRGQSDAAWRLIPAAFRTGSWAPFKRPDKLPFDPTVPHEQDYCQEFEEAMLLGRYLSACDRAGLHIQDHVAVRPIFAAPTRNPKFFESEPARVFMALAQHYGVPTRLLDWTRVGLNAAYFAAEGAVRDGSKGDFAVWALSLDLMCRISEPRYPLPINLELFLAPRAANPNLGAQDGLFTLWWRNEPTVPLLMSLEDVLVSTLQPLRARDSFYARTALVRFDVPASEAASLLRMLADERVDGSRLFPGYAGAARGLREETLWDRESGAPMDWRRGSYL